MKNINAQIESATRMNEQKTIQNDKQNQKKKKKPEIWREEEKNI